MNAMPIVCHNCGRTASVALERITSSLRCVCGSNDIDIDDRPAPAVASRRVHAEFPPKKKDDEKPEEDDDEDDPFAAAPAEESGDNPFASGEEEQEEDPFAPADSSTPPSSAVPPVDPNDPAANTPPTDAEGQPLDVPEERVAPRAETDADVVPGEEDGLNGPVDAIPDELIGAVVKGDTERALELLMSMPSGSDQQVMARRFMAKRLGSAPIPKGTYTQSSRKVANEDPSYISEMLTRTDDYGYSVDPALVAALGDEDLRHVWQRLQHDDIPDRLFSEYGRGQSLKRRARELITNLLIDRQTTGRRSSEGSRRRHGAGSYGAESLAPHTGRKTSVYAMSEWDDRGYHCEERYLGDGDMDLVITDSEGEWAYANPIHASGTGRAAASAVIDRLIAEKSGSRRHAISGDLPFPLLHDVDSVTVKVRSIYPPFEEQSISLQPGQAPPEGWTVAGPTVDTHVGPGTIRQFPNVTTTSSWRPAGKCEQCDASVGWSNSENRYFHTDDMGVPDEHRDHEPTLDGHGERYVSSRDRKVAEIVRGIRATNPGMSPRQAVRIAHKTIQRFPAMVKSAMPNPVDLGVKVGDIFVSSWGYDQTNTDYYEVTALTGASVKVRPIGKIQEPDSVGNYQTMPKPGAFVGDEMTKRIQGGEYEHSRPGFKVNSHSYAFLWEGSSAYETGPYNGH